jgi:TetR/AcrR family transcriptional regulator, transcriptional repressor for nem operon
MPRTKAFDKNEMVEKAKQLFWKKGYEGTSMEELVTTLGISRSSLYDTFGDKHQLYCETLNSYCKQNVYTLSPQSIVAANPLQFIKDVFALVLQQAKKDTEKKGCYVVNSIVEFSNRDEDVKSITDANNKAFEKMLEQLIQRGQADGSITSTKSPIRVGAKSNSGIKDLEDVAATALEVLQN